MREQILNALRQLDATNADHWTALGLPRIDVVAALAGLPGLKRHDIAAVAPDFARDFSGEPVASDSPVDPLASVRINLEAARAELAEVYAEQSTLTRREAELRRRIDLLQARVTAAEPASDDVRLRMEFIRSQQEVRAVEAAKRQALADAGFDLAIQRAPIDAAMSRHRGRGHSRPQFPLKAN